MAADLSPKEVLDLVPQREPFRFVDELLELDEEHVVGSYTWPPQADFYRGHFPGHPVTPGVLLVECMAQSSIVPLAIYLRHRAGRGDDGSVPFFTEADVEFTGVVPPGARVRIEARKLFYRRGKLRAEVEMTDEDGRVVCSGTLSGLEVRP